MMYPSNSGMVYPSNFCLALLVAGSVLLAVAWHSPLVWMAVAVCVGIVITDAVLAFATGKHCQPLPVATTRMRIGQAGLVRIVLVGADAMPHWFHLGLDQIFTDVVAKNDINSNTDSPTNTQVKQLQWTALPTRRGAYKTGLLVLEWKSTLGLWIRRRDYNTQGEIHVHPEVHSLRGQVVKLLGLGGVSGQNAIHSAGKGREFEKLRDYVVGDTMDDIHWKATARRGKPVTRLYQVERRQDVHILLDTSRLSMRSEAGQQIVLERLVASTALFLQFVQTGGDRLGLTLFDGRIRQHLDAGSGMAHWAACRNLLMRVEPTLSSPDWNELVQYIRNRIPRRSLIIVLTAFEDRRNADRMGTALAHLGNRHVVLVLDLVRDSLLHTTPLPSAHAELERVLVQKRMQTLSQRLRTKGMEFITVNQDQLAPMLVQRYLHIKKRQVL